MSRPWVKLDAQTHTRLENLLATDTERFAYYAALEAGKLAESEGEWADERDFAATVGPRLAEHLPALVAAGLLCRTPEGWVRVVDWDLLAKLDPTNAARQKRWRDRRRTEAEALRNALQEARNALVTPQTEETGEIDGQTRGARANGSKERPTGKNGVHSDDGLTAFQRRVPRP